MSGRRIEFQLEISGDDRGTIEATYIALSGNRVAKTRPIIEDILLADYDSEGNLVGIEILAPVKLADLTRLVQEPARGPFRKFVKQAAPSDLIMTSTR